MMMAKKTGVTRSRFNSLVRSVDCSLAANAGDLLSLLFIAIVCCVLIFAVLLAYYTTNFISGFVASTIIWKWKAWLWRPMDKILNKVYGSNVNPDPLGKQTLTELTGVVQVGSRIWLAF
jgi:hypothetical protein